MEARKGLCLGFDRNNRSHSSFKSTRAELSVMTRHSWFFGSLITQINFDQDIQNRPSLFARFKRVCGLVRAFGDRTSYFTPGPGNQAIHEKVERSQIV
jgi:hypothetical protein